MGGMYLGLKSRAMMLKREQTAREERQASYAVSTHRSGESCLDSETLIGSEPAERRSDAALYVGGGV